MPIQPYVSFRSRLQGPTPEDSGEGQSSGSNFRSRLYGQIALDRSTSRVSHPALSPASQAVVDQFRVGSALEPSSPPTARPTRVRTTAGRSVSSVELGGSLEKLSDALTEAGSTIHAFAVERLVQEHARVQRRIGDFVNESSKILDMNAALYSNFERDMSKTLCSDENHPQATLASHLDRLSEQLRQAEDKLASLAQEWDHCVSLENIIWQRLSSEHRIELPNADYRDTAVADVDLAMFEKEAREIASAKADLIDRIDREFKQKIQVETQKMLHDMTTW